MSSLNYKSMLPKFNELIAVCLASYVYESHRDKNTVTATRNRGMCACERY